MQAFLGAESMPRTQVVKAIWDYIKANNLQVGSGAAAQAEGCCARQQMQDSRCTVLSAWVETCSGLPATGVTMFCW